MNPIYKIPTRYHLAGAFEAARRMARLRVESEPMYLELKPETRTVDQNSKLWPMLHDVAKQVPWDGYDLTETEWKNLFTGSMDEMKTVTAIDRPGVVMLGKATSIMSRRKFSELIEFIYAFGAAHDVQWSEKSEETYRERNA